MHQYLWEKPKCLSDNRSFIFNNKRCICASKLNVGDKIKFLGGRSNDVYEIIRLSIFIHVPSCYIILEEQRGDFAYEFLNVEFKHLKSGKLLDMNFTFGCLETKDYIFLKANRNK